MTRPGRSEAMVPSDESPARSVFRTPDQQEMIARLDAIEDDDVETDFFSTSAQEAEDAAVRMFDLGIRTLGSEQEIGSASSFPSRGNSDLPSRVNSDFPSRVNSDFASSGDLHDSSGEGGSAGQAPVEPSLDDPRYRRAFILGGPAALGRVD